MRFLLTLLLAFLFLVSVLPGAVRAETNSPKKTIDVRRDFQDKRIDTKQDFKDKRQEAIEDFRVKREEAVQATKERREEFREKLTEIRDERKKKILENLDQKVENINSKWVSHWNSALARLTEILAKISERTDDSSVEALVSEAEAAISRAQSAVNEQAGKAYEIEVGDEKALGQNVRSTLKEFREDLREVHATVSGAREAVGKTLRAVKSVVESEGNGE